jgi:hypothetical protein
MLVGTAVYLGGGMTVAGFGVLHQPGPVIALFLVGIVVGGLTGAKWWKDNFQT